MKTIYIKGNQHIVDDAVADYITVLHNIIEEAVK